jgi:hypothetical protein
LELENVLAEQRLLNIDRVLGVWGLLHYDPVVELDMNEQGGPRNDNDYSTDIQAGDQQVEQGIYTFSPYKTLESVLLRVKLRASASMVSQVDGYLVGTHTEETTIGHEDRTLPSPAYHS